MSYTYEYNTKPNLCYYVNLNTYTKGKFGNTDFNPPLSDPIKKDIVSFQMSNYNSLRSKSVPINPIDNYQSFGNSYNDPICELCSKSDCK